MTSQAHSNPTGDRHHWIAGTGLIAIGLLALAGQFLLGRMLGLFLLPAIGLVLLLWGSATRSAGLLIPGGILFLTHRGHFGPETY